MTHAAAPSRLFYRLDARDRIVEVGGDWDNFARSNGGAVLAGRRVLGTNLFQHVHGDSTRLLLWVMFDGVRKLMRPAIRPWRCDSPFHRRFMEMSVVHDGGGGLVVTHRLVSVAPAEARKGPLPSRRRMEIRCCMCDAIRVGSSWIAASQLPARAHAPIDGLEEAPTIVHGVCGACSERVGRMPSIG